MIGPAAGVYFVRLFDSDNGKKIHLNVADELQITLSEAPAATPYSWSVASYTKSVLAYTQSNGVADPNNPQLNIRTFIFCPRQPGQGEVKLQRGTQEWQCTVIVK
ncbi:MAG TPA: protease inhibitor I42 family protein [Candidatus Obscuribacterales bacterium]